MRSNVHVGSSLDGHGSCVGGILGMPVRFKVRGCMFSIIASVVLTIALNLLVRACMQ